MVDLTDPSPLVMTNFERVATFAALAALLVAIAIDLWRGSKGRAAVPEKADDESSP